VGSACLDCPTGQYSLSRASDSCTLCSAGYYAASVVRAFLNSPSSLWPLWLTLPFWRPAKTRRRCAPLFSLKLIFLFSSSLCFWVTFYLRARRALARCLPRAITLRPRARPLPQPAPRAPTPRPWRPHAASVPRATSAPPAPRPAMAPAPPVRCRLEVYL
jgi:hypothetical protein